MQVDKSVLASVIFDSDSKIKESEYQAICESIESDSVSLNEILLGYKKKVSILEGACYFVLQDGSKVLISEDVIDMLSELNIDKQKLVSFMSESKGNLESVIRKVIQ